MIFRPQYDSMPFPEHLVHGFALAAFVWAAAPAMPLMAQGLESEGAIETIIDAEVGTAEKGVREEEARIAAAIDKSQENAAEIRKRFQVNEVEIVFVPELSQGQSKLDEKIKDNGDAIKELQTAIESSAIFFHAIDSHQVLLRDVVAVEFGDGDKITIFAAGKEPQN
jgi:hypothetical protein